MIEMLGYTERSTAALEASPCPSPHAAVGGGARMANYKPIPTLSLEQAEFFWSHVQEHETDRCWRWVGTIRNGYGIAVIDGRNYRAHRIAFTLMRGPIPDGLTLDHLCRVRSCCNPDHLEAVTLSTNVLRGMSPTAQHARKTHCPKGHEYTAGNTRHRRGRRECLVCTREQRKAKKAWRSGPHKERLVSTRAK